MNKGRLEAFSDGLMAVLITIMVLELHVPRGGASAIPPAFVLQWVSDCLYVAVALMWLIPDRRIESRLGG